MRYWKKKPIKGEPRVGLVIPTYCQTHVLACLIHALRAQTYPHFKALVYHDGPAGAEIWRTANDAMADWVTMDGELHYVPDARFKFIATKERANRFGHNLRRLGFKELDDCAYLGSINGDNYIVPVFLEALVHALKSEKAGLAYVDCVHSHKLWQPMKTELKRGKIDIACWLADAELVRSTPWKDESFAGDWHFLEALLKRKPKIAKVSSTLVVHN